MQKNIGIVGVSGYTGLELIKILLNHRHFRIAYLANTSGGARLGEIHPSLVNAQSWTSERESESKNGVKNRTKDSATQKTPANTDISNMEVQKIDLKKIKDLELVFLALPHEESMKIVPKILESGVKVVDLSADYRLSEANFNKTYSKHLDSKNLKNAVYGLVEWNRENIKTANLIANPGCYPTASLLGILPFLPYLGDGSIFIDAKSGVSGAGKKLSENTHYPTINENIFSYSPLTHRHQIEITEKCEFFGRNLANLKNSRNLVEKNVGNLADLKNLRNPADLKNTTNLKGNLKSILNELNISFIPHLSPFTRGMLASIFIRLDKKIAQKLDPLEILKETYKNEPFIRIRENPVDVKSVAGTHFCDIFAKKNGSDLYVNTSIDNLLRGASSQAVANANLMCGIDESSALPRVAYVP
ncbi:N-acetyl-gamma-glutamyl-phosphate reductase [Helicobacter sp. 16-1353]|uniref:N-acetyl-gamma-glutamyl-phosphate reductase n=1 Tax=Helicobacter sp. 16-1353 TaxID=2004996 RepID=UPI000DCB065F|nr:NAGSA dehydrogenase family protein [Helicobacter sp. 16-1353]RAX54388.1 N-acetyl-gamma-glutamyl-phosphate reductase [Helicobacter sp. 16-1353]